MLGLSLNNVWCSTCLFARTSACTCERDAVDAGARVAGDAGRHVQGGALVHGRLAVPLPLPGQGAAAARQVERHLQNNRDVTSDVTSLSFRNCNEFSTEVKRVTSDVMFLRFRNVKLH